MQAIIVVAIASLLFCSANASEYEKKELMRKSQEFMNKFYYGILKHYVHLKGEGKSYSAKEMEALTAVTSAKEFIKHLAAGQKLTALLDKLKESGEVSQDFKIHDQGSPELKEKVEKAIRDLISKDEVSPRVIGAAITGITQIITDTIRMLLTRYTEPR